MPAERFRFLILGAGPTGLGAAYRLKDHGISDFRILEADTRVGGLSKSFVDDKGFTWDIGGHVQFSHYPYFDDVMNDAIPAKEWFNHERESWVWMRDRFVPYPFQNNLRFLPREDMWAGVEGFVDAFREAQNPRPKPANFGEWIRQTFGKGVAEMFMEPYNFKVWATPPPLMSYQWIGERVAVPDLKRILGNIVLERNDVSWGPNNTFRFPPHGGTGAIWEKVADRVGRDKIRLSTEVTKIFPSEKRLVTATGQEFEYEFLLSTIPLDHLVDKVHEFPADLKAEAKQLVHSSTNVVGIGMEGRIPKHLDKKCWLYFPESDCPFYRATVFSHYSRFNVPKPESQWSLMLEVSESPHKPVNQATLKEETRQGCVNTKLIRPDEKILSLTSFRVKYGYPVPSLRRDEILAKVQPELERRGVFSRGRFGGWKYEVSNQDHSMMQGVEWADRMVTGAAEDTYACKKGLGPKEAPLPKPKAA